MSLMIESELILLLLNENVFKGHAHACHCVVECH